MPGERAQNRQILKITGADRVDFLQGLVTNDVAKLDQGLVYAALLSAQGKYLVDFFMVPAPDAVLIDVASDHAAGLLKRLTMYRLRADVQITPDDMAVARGLGTPPEGAYQDPRHPDLGWRVYGQSGDETSAEPQIDWDAIRVAHLIPETGIELTPDDSYILEMGFERLNGVDFKKGCYVGQEVTARMKHKTELRKGLAQVSVEGPAAPGTPITANQKPAGTLHTVAGNKALAYLRYDRANGAMVADNAQISYAR